MTKFVYSMDGQYINVDQITSFCVLNRISKKYCVKCFIAMPDEDRAWIICDEFENIDEAQEWLDKFMTAHGLCIEPVTPSRCF